MTLLQRISRNAKNVILLCPRSLRYGGRRRSLNIAIFIFCFLMITFYMTEQQSQRSQALVEKPKVVEKRAHVVNEPSSSITLTSKSPTEQKDVIKYSDVTRAITAATPNDEIEESPTTSTKSTTTTTTTTTITTTTTTTTTTTSSSTKKSLKKCTKFSRKLVGDMNSNPNITPSMEEVAKHVGPDLRIGGCYSPIECEALQKVAVLIPFKDRDAHLKTLLYYLHPMLMRQRLHYCVYVAEQFDNGQFNKATVMNAAFEEVLKLDNYSCIIFHDVDMIPENDKNFYMCGKQPRHLSPAIDKFEYKPHYGTDFGGVTGITVEQYRKANGHSNRFWGWGGEDNDMEFRIAHRNMSIIPSSLKIGRYKMIPHLHPWKFSPNKYPYRLNNTRKARADVDGLSDLQYRLLDTIRHPMYTKLVIDIRKIVVTKMTLYIDGRNTMDIDLTPDHIDPTKCRWETYLNKTLEKHERIDNSQYTYSSLSEAKAVCDNMHALCGGIVREIGGYEFTLQKKGPPKHSNQELMRLLLSKSAPHLYGALGNDLRMAWVKLRKQAATGDFTLDRKDKKDLKTDTHVVLDPDKAFSKTGKYLAPTLEQVLKHNTTAYVKYCPGFYGAHQNVPVPLRQSIYGDLNNWITENDGKLFKHFFAFQIDIEVVGEPTDYMYYTDEKHFESHLEKGENHYTFKWPRGMMPNFTDPKTERKYSFRTPDFAIPNIPGTYAVESKIVDKLTQPYFQWNWWFEVTSGDFQLDAQARDVYWKQKMKENVAKGKAVQHQKVENEKAAKAKRNQAEFEKGMSKMKKNPGNKKMPPGIAAIVEKMQNAYDKHSPEGDPAAEFLNPNDPVFQKNVGEIRIAGKVPEPKPTLKTTTTSALKRIIPHQAQFHVGKPKKKN